MGKPGQILQSKCSIRYYCKIVLDLLFSKIIDYQKSYQKLLKTSIFFKKKDTLITADKLLSQILAISNFHYIDFLFDPFNILIIFPHNFVWYLKLR